MIVDYGALAVFIAFFALMVFAKFAFDKVIKAKSLSDRFKYLLQYVAILAIGIAMGWAFFLYRGVFSLSDLPFHR
ncbi:hypothetical protein [Microvirga sp. 2TAF3]|uniref:hypothetical protein n=1 Tax=Microvirga sp. 2TAF3 TaxID=3233014 RepID=UPI003F9BD98F